MAKPDTRSIALHSSGSGPSLVLLHCLGVDHRFWYFCKPLESEYRRLRSDFPGHGATHVPEKSFSIEDLSQQLADILKNANVSSAHVAGISLGGLVAQHFAATHPRMVDRLILIDTTPRYTDEMQLMWADRAKTARESGVEALVDGLLKIWFSADVIAQNRVAVQYVRKALQNASGEGYALVCEALAATDLREDAAKIEARTLILCGDNDIPSFLDAAKWLHANIRTSRLEWIPGTRHASVIEAPDIALNMIRSFLAEHH